MIDELARRVLTEEFQSLGGLELLSIEEARKVTAREAPLLFGSVEDVASVEDRIIAGTIRARIHQPHAKATGTLCGTSSTRV
jgi:hypothetical protein